KLRELARVLQGWDLGLLDTDRYPPEEGSTYYENALAKARYGLRFVDGGWVLGEDSGIEVDGLGGGPGIRSARFGGGAPGGRLGDCARSSTASTATGAWRDTSASSSRCRRGARRRVARASWRAGSPTSPPAARASATTRSSCRPGRSGRSRSLATSGRPRTRIAPAPHATSCEPCPCRARPGSDPGHVPPGRTRHARPDTSGNAAASRRANRHELTSAPKTIAFAMT